MDSALQALLDHPDFHEGSHWHRRAIPAQESVFQEGDEGRDVYWVLRGSLRVVGDVEVEPQRRVRPGICDLPTGAVFGELALFDAGPRSATVTALEDAEIAVLDGPRLLDFFEQHPELGYRIMRELLAVVVRRMRKTNKKLVSLFAWGLKAHQIE